MDDRQLIELAAEAAGYEIVLWGNYLPNAPYVRTNENEEPRCWIPLWDNGDAFCLAVKLGISIEPYPLYQPDKVSVITKQRRSSDMLRENNPTEVIERYYNGGPYVATRRAIVQTAAEIGRLTP